MEFRLLGPVEAVVAGEPVELGRRRERGVLAALLIEVGRPVPADRLVELLFEADGPRDPRKALQVDVSRLRRSLTAAVGEDDVQLVREPGGYSIQVDPSTVDVHRFTALVEDARGTDETAERARLLGDALALWRGSALADIPGGVALESVRARLEESRLAAIELRVEADLASGRHAELVAELADLTARHPSSEGLVAAQMLALYRSGRKRDALDVYQQAADRMADELGLDPGPELRETHLAILRDEAEAAAPAHSTSPPAPTVRPAQLPADLPVFTGREDELASLLARSRLPREAVVVSAIGGMAGIGKTALAVHAAHRLAADYPDGQLFIDLNGFTEGVDPVTPGDALARLLRSLGVPDARIPTETDDRAALYRSTLADRRVLVLLDNAATEDQVEPLLPGASGCLVMITSRSQLAGLDRANPLSLDVLPADDAATLFTQVVGTSRLADEPVELVHEVVELCGRLPLATRIAAARLRSRTAWTLPHLRDRLRDERRRLAELEAGQRSVTGVFRLSYRQLSTGQARMFRLLGLSPGWDFDLRAAAALADCPAREAERLLDELVDVRLLQEPQPGRYRFHDLLRAFAAQRVADDETETDRNAAYARLLSYYTDQASAAMDVRYPREAARRPAVAKPPTGAGAVGRQTEATQWLDAELDNLLLVAGHAATAGRPTAVARLAQIIWRHLHTRGRFGDAARLHALALDACRQTGDRPGEVKALLGIGRAHYMQKRHVKAVECYQNAERLADEIEDHIGLLDALIGLARVQHSRGELDSASRNYEWALGLAREAGDPDGELDALGGLGLVHTLRGSYQAAAELQERSLVLNRSAGDQVGELSSLNALTLTRFHEGDHDVAAMHNRRALRLAREIGHRPREIEALTLLGDLDLVNARHAAAADHYRQALAMAHDIGDRNRQFEALYGLGVARLDAGDAHEALEHHQQALAIAQEIGHRSDEARARACLGQALHDLERDGAARQHWDQALAIFTELGLPEAERVETSLAELDKSTPA